MSERRIFILNGPTPRQSALQGVRDAQEGYCVTITPPSRSTDQNAAQWPVLHAFSKQLAWPVNGRMVNMTPDDWKNVLTAAFRKEQALLAMGLDGGVVMLGLRTSKFTKKEFSEWLEFLHATAIDRGVVVYPDAPREFIDDDGVIHGATT